MKSSIFSGIHNPLSPFLLLLALIILATIIISNIQSEQEKQWFRNAAPRELQYDPSLPTRIDDMDSQYASPMLEPDIQRLTAAALDDWARGDFTAAEDKFRTILVFRPNNAVALSHLGALLSHRGDYKTAELMFRNQTLFYPGDPNAYLNLATVLAKQKRLPEALAASKQSLALSPGGAANHLSLAKIYSLANNRKMALDFFRRAAGSLGARLVEASWDPSFDNIRQTPEFQELVREAKQKSKGTAP